MSARITKFVNGLLLKDGQLSSGDLWVSSGKIISSQSTIHRPGQTEDEVVDLKGQIIAPGFIDVQLNGYHGLDFANADAEFDQKFDAVRQELVKSGVTAFTPTMTSSSPDVYHANLPHLGRSTSREAFEGTECLGAHVEGPFIHPKRNGIHPERVLMTAQEWSDIEACYGAGNLKNIRYITAAPELGDMTRLIPAFTARGIIFSIGHSDATFEQAQEASKAGATMVTHLFNAMRPFGHRETGIFGLLGQSPSPPATPSTPKFATPPTPKSAMPPTPPSAMPPAPPFAMPPAPSFAMPPIPSPSATPATPATPTLSPKQMSPLPSPIPESLGKAVSEQALSGDPSCTPSPTNSADSADSSPRSFLSASVYLSPPSSPLPDPPFFGLISDGIHLSPPTLKIAYSAHPTGAILVTDAMPLTGLPDGVYPWNNGEEIVKQGSLLTLEKNGRIAGSAIGLLECVNNFVQWTGCGVAEGLRAVTETPARMLGESEKGRLDVGCDADLCVLQADGDGKLALRQVWKFGVCVHAVENDAEEMAWA